LAKIADNCDHNIDPRVGSRAALYVVDTCTVGSRGSESRTEPFGLGAENIDRGGSSSTVGFSFKIGVLGVVGKILEEIGLVFSL
jgi:hypothetical protein